jgi:hypothetical protein
MQLAFEYGKDALLVGDALECVLAPVFERDARGCAGKVTDGVRHKDFVRSRVAPVLLIRPSGYDQTTIT